MPEDKKWGNYSGSKPSGDGGGKIPSKGTIDINKGHFTGGAKSSPSGKKPGNK